MTGHARLLLTSSVDTFRDFSKSVAHCVVVEHIVNLIFKERTFVSHFCGLHTRLDHTLLDQVIDYFLLFLAPVVPSLLLLIFLLLLSFGWCHDWLLRFFSGCLRCCFVKRVKRMRGAPRCGKISPAPKKPAAS